MHIRRETVVPLRPVGRNARQNFKIPHTAAKCLIHKGNRLCRFSEQCNEILWNQGFAAVGSRISTKLSTEIRDFFANPGKSSTWRRNCTHNPAATQSASTFRGPGKRLTSDLCTHFCERVPAAVWRCAESRLHCTAAKRFDSYTFFAPPGRRGYRREPAPMRPGRLSHCGCQQSYPQKLWMVVKHLTNQPLSPALHTSP